MAETTTNDPALVVGQPHRHPAIRRLARACIALARWQRAQAVAAPAEAATDDLPDADSPEPGHA